MVTRREVLLSALCVPVAHARPLQRTIEIVAGEDLSAQESALGYRLASKRVSAGPSLVFAAVREWSLPMVRHAKRAMADGGFVVVEYGPEFRGRRVPTPRYLSYTWPKACLIRSFGPAVALDANGDEVIARAGQVPIAVRRDRLIILGSMFGPQLFAEDREAHELWRLILVRCGGRFCDGTSTTT